MTESEVPSVWAERLDAAAASGSGEVFGGVLQGLFGYLERARNEAEAPVECGDYFIRWKRFCTEPEGHGGRHRNCEISWDDE